MNANEAIARTDSPSPLHFHIRSCSSCRQRKVKCDRQRPCVNCVRSGVECAYPPGRGRAPKRPRGALNAQLSQRLSRLELIIRSFETSGNQGNSMLHPTGPTLQSSTAESGVPQTHPLHPGSSTSNSDSELSIEQRLGRLLINETQSYYVSNVLWANLGDEIAELRDLLHEPELEEDNYMLSERSVLERPLPSGSNAAILGFRALAHSLRPYHPPLAQSATLFELFKDNVAPMVRIFHMPTLARSHWDAIASLESLDRDAEALLFAIYYSTVISMDSEQCASALGVSKAYASETYLFAVEQALARADLLNTQSVTLLQAAVLFLFALRNEDDSRTVWSLTSLIFHIAQAMGLHRDGIVFGLKPMETELRRRLWWHICLLDARSSEYHGCEPIVRESAFDTRLPLNIEDSDLTAEMTEPPVEREGATSMYFCLIRCEVMRTMWKISCASRSMGTPGLAKGRLSLEERESLVQNLHDRLEGRYLKNCDISKPFFLASTFVARLMVARAWLIARYPLSEKEYGVDLSGPVRDRLFLSSVEVLELSSMVLTNEKISHWSWHSKTHIQWHAVAFVLSEICTRPPSADCDRAWEYVNIVYNNWKMKESGRKGTLWRPIRRLMAKAQYVREMQKLDPLGRWQRRAAPTDDIQQVPGPASFSNMGMEYMPPPGDPICSGIGDLPSSLLMEAVDPFQELFPGVPQTEGFIDEANNTMLNLDEHSQIPEWLVPEWISKPPGDQA
ncbi:uncharacterized protein BO80DRAFT_347732 [Aspergillus ibericus CBS 121593]|uniref:Zn(2)-C6 fungal-type domain-containing protein n=1 Tax=Aspergillus ibericus CBS 121593 TaxID=1448316 RepID=A0A395H985_9EURO|nr:hypothetical protein BO80DRAFT_347732 [Aspergillus ibericus CBS 121593]RAL04412.1 hypothetical protein BO80DRAFT_347732 [Aspergillus ibericus CBS 121593]